MPHPLPFSKNRKSSATSRKALRKVEGSKADIAMDKKMGHKEGSMADMRQDMMLAKKMSKRGSSKPFPKR